MRRYLLIALLAIAGCANTPATPAPLTDEQREWCLANLDIVEAAGKRIGIDIANPTDPPEGGGFLDDYHTACHEALKAR